MKHLSVVSSLVLLVAALTSCVSGPVELTPAMVGAKDVVLVGSVSFSPSIEFEKYVKSKDGKGTFEISNKPMVGLFMSHQSQLLNAEFQLNNDVFYLNNEVGSIFIGKVQRKEVAYLRGFVLDLGMTYSVGALPGYSGLAPAAWPGRFKVEVPEEGTALYLGHMEIKLDDQYRMVGLVIKDMYDEAKPAFEEKFPGFELVRADIQELSKK